MSITSAVALAMFICSLDLLLFALRRKTDCAAAPCGGVLLVVVAGVLPLGMQLAPASSRPGMYFCSSCGWASRPRQPIGPASSGRS